MLKAVSSHNYAKGSGALIYGTPRIVAVCEDYIDNLGAYLENAISKVVPNYERSLQKKATIKGWKEHADEIAVTYDSKTLSITIEGDAKSEYGTGVEPPKSVIRSAATDVDSLERLINQQIKKDLF